MSSEKGELSRCVERLRRKSTIMLTGTPTQSEVGQLVRLFTICDKSTFRDMYLEKEDIFDDPARRDLFQRVCRVVNSFRSLSRVLLFFRL